jgi:hypothetical protein
LKRIVMVVALVVVAVMSSAGPVFGVPTSDLLVGGCAGNNNATNKLESQGIDKASPDLFANCGEDLLPGQKVREAA